MARLVKLGKLKPGEDTLVCVVSRWMSALRSERVTFTAMPIFAL